jgi:predicted kinase
MVDLVTDQLDSVLGGEVVQGFNFGVADGRARRVVRAVDQNKLGLRVGEPLDLVGVDAGTRLVSAMGPGTLHFISGRLAAGKTTLARKLSDEHQAVLFCEDVWLSKLSDGITSFDDYLKWSRRCRAVMGPLIVDILRAGASVVLDFAGNWINEREWARSLSEQAGSSHLLHVLDVDEDECLRRLLMRNQEKPDGLYFASTTEAEFRAICKYFQDPTPAEDLSVIRHGA